jgi:hypothetical protein
VAGESGSHRERVQRTLDFKINQNWSSYVRVFHDQATSRDPQDVSGRFFKITINPTNAIFNLQGILGHGAINEFKFGYNAAPSTEGADTQAGFENIALSLQGTVANAGIAGRARPHRGPAPAASSE